MFVCLRYFFLFELLLFTLLLISFIDNPAVSNVGIECLTLIYFRLIDEFLLSIGLLERTTTTIMILGQLKLFYNINKII